MTKFGDGVYTEVELLEEAALDFGTCHITLRDEVNCNIQGLKSFHREALIKDWSLNVEGAYFMPSYQKGSWDGKIKYVKANGNTYINLLEDMVPWIIDLGYQIQLIDKRKPRFYPGDIDSGFLPPILLRYYQVDSVNEALRNGQGILELATGAGKTYINAAIIKRYEPLRSLTIVPNADLVRQTAASFVKVGLDTGFYYGKKKLLEHKHIVGTWQAIKNKQEILKDFQVVLVDEVHGAKANVLFKLLTEGYGAQIQYRFGMTGTIPKPKADRASIKSALGPVIFKLTAKELIDKKYLANLEITIAQLQDCLTEHLNWDAEKAFLTRNKKRLAAISSLIISVAQKGNTLILVESIKAGQTLHAFIPGSTFLYGKTDTDDRAEEYNSFGEEDNKIVIATYGIARAGIDIQRIFNLVLVDGGKAFVRAIQTIGRGLRRASDKHHVNILDICSNGKYSQKHMKERIRYYREAKYPFRIEQVEL